MLTTIESYKISVISLGWSLDVLNLSYWSRFLPLVAAFTFEATTVASALPAV